MSKMSLSRWYFKLWCLRTSRTKLAQSSLSTEYVSVAKEERASNTSTFSRGKQSPGAVNNGVIHTLKSSDRMNNSRVAVAWK